MNIFPSRLDQTVSVVQAPSFLKGRIDCTSVSWVERMKRAPSMTGVRIVFPEGERQGSSQSRFPVASDEKQSVMKSFDAVMQTRPEYANRVTYVIAPDGSIVYNYQSLNPARHIEKTLSALRSWRAQKK